jgi:peptide/nickel transport system substrate-binding protein
MPFDARHELVRVAQPHVRLGDPHVCSDDRHRLSLIRALYEPLVTRGLSGGHLPALARSWEVDATARHWRFALQPGVRWHDGRPLAADDVVASLVRIRDDAPAGELGTSGVYASYLRGATVTADGTDRVAIDLAEPTADLLDVLADLVVLPARHLAEADRTPPGSGPLRALEVADECVVMGVNGDYWGGATGVERVEWRAWGDPASRLEAVAAGRVDIASDAADLSPPSGLRTLRRPSSVATTFMFRLGDGTGGTRDVRIRRALNHAVDVREIASRLLAGHADLLASPCTPTQLGYDPQLAPYAYDPSLAQRLLHEADAVGATFAFDIPLRLPDEAPRLAALLAEQLERVGVTLEIVEHADRSAYADTVRSKGIHDAACFDSSPHSTFRLFLEKFHAGHRGPWWLGYASPAFDALVDRGRTETDVGARRATYRRAARLLHDDAPWLYLYAARLAWTTGPAAAAWSPTPDGLVTFSPARNGA